MKLDRGRLVAGGIGVVVGVAATLGVVVYRNGALERRCNEEFLQVSIRLRADATPEQVEDLERELLDSGDVESLEYVSEEEALERYRELYEDPPELVETLEVGAIPASFEVVATDDDARHRLWDTSSPAIDDVRSGRDDQFWAKCLLNDLVPDGELET